MKSSIQWIVVLRLARRAHPELCHRSLWPVVGNPPRNRESRSAIRAIQKWIPVSPVFTIQQLPQAIPAGRRIRRNPRTYPSQNLARNNPKLHISRKGQLPRYYGINSRQRWRFRPQPLNERLHLLPRPFNFNRYPIRIVPNKTRQSLLMRKPIYKGPETHSLHHSAHHHPAPQCFAPFSS